MLFSVGSMMPVCFYHCKKKPNTWAFLTAGTTQGRERHDKPKKDVWLRPLRKNWKRTLNS